MIIKSNEIHKLKLNNYFLFYGKNDEQKKEIVNKLIKDKKVLYYEEKEILDNPETFIESNLTSSLFENEKIIIIKRSTDKILETLKIIFDKAIDNLSIILDSENLEKKSKIRNFFEKDKNKICVPFYPDNEITLFKFATNTLNKLKLKLSQSNINLIINKSNGDRNNLKNNLKKIEYFTLGGKKIDETALFKLLNVSENESFSVLADYYLAKNEKKIIAFLNDNILSNEDCIIIIRTLLNKIKKLLKIFEQYDKNKNLDSLISSFRPPIFWKDKPIVKEQILKWSTKNLKELAYKTTELEFKIKKNSNNSTNLITDFLLNQSLKTNSWF